MSDLIIGGHSQSKLHCLFRRVIWFWALLAVLSTWSTASMADRRVALVVGNGAYKNVPNLPNPPKDAQAIAALLRNLGFDVVSGEDLTHDAMTDVLRKFATQADGADVALFFYAGHGLQLDGKNYLLPIDSNPKSELDVKLGGPIDVNTLLDQTMATAKVKLVFLDACRDNPFVEQISRSLRTRSITVGSGLAEMKSSEGTLLAFATSPGQVALDGQGGHSPFTKALLDNLGAPNDEISVALTKVRAEVADLTQKQQSPWASTNLTGLFYMNRTQVASAAPTSAAIGSATPSDSAASAATTAGDPVEVEFWRSVKDSYKVEELNAYLTRYPDGAFSSIARARLAAIDTRESASNSRTLSQDIDPAVHTADSSRQTEDALSLDRSDVRDIQKRLKALGFSTATDGRMGDDTRRAIKNWEAARNYPSSGYLNKLQWDALRAEDIPKSALADDDSSDDSSHRSSAGSSSGVSRRQGAGPSGPPTLMGPPIMPFFNGGGRSLFGR